MASKRLGRLTVAYLQSDSSSRVVPHALFTAQEILRATKGTVFAT
jgi:hypothetical protein